MGKLIDVNEFAKYLYEHIRNDNLRIYAEVCNYLKDFPEVEAEHKKHGHWIGKPIAGYSTVKCSHCHNIFLENKGTWKYCPECGARMEE
mgnify:CR=1 FL=1